MTRTQQAATLREQGLDNDQIAAAMGTYRQNVQALLWRVDSPDKAREHNRDAMRLRRTGKPSPEGIRQWWQARGY